MIKCVWCSRNLEHINTWKDDKLKDAYWKCENCGNLKLIVDFFQERWIWVNMKTGAKKILRMVFRERD